jgi:ClpP class serine protease
MRALDLAQSIPWAVTEDMLRTMLEIAARENTASGLEVAQAIRTDRLTRQAVMLADGRPLDGTKSMIVRDGIAIQLVEGPIFRRADFFTEVSGGATVDTLAKDFALALDTPTVRSILMVFDSPGGEVTGINEFAAAIYAARGRKPITAYVEGIGASAAYWLASATDRIVIDRTAVVGSIGVVMAVRDPSKTNARDIEFVSSQSPNKRPNPLTEGGKSQLQTLVDDMAAVFVASVALHRGVSEETVVTNFGAGGVFVGQAAVDAGLVDGLGSFESTLANLQQQSQQAARIGARAEGRMGSKEEKTELRADVPSGQIESFVQPPATGQTVALAPSDADRIARLEQQLSAERAARFRAEAASFSGQALASGKAFPPEQETLQAAYVRAAMDDADQGSTERVTLLSKMIDSRPSHGLTTELVPALAGATVLTNNTDDTKETTRERESARAYASKRNGNGHAAGKER